MGAQPAASIYGHPLSQKVGSAGHGLDSVPQPLGLCPFRFGYKCAKHVSYLIDPRSSEGPR